MLRRAFVRSTLATFGAPLLAPDPLAGLFRPVGRTAADLEAVRGDGTRVTIPGAAVVDLSRGIKGKVLLAGAPGYDAARTVLNPVIDRHPALIAQPTSAADVQRVVRFAREHGLLTAVKCGGHSFSGQSTCEKGLQVDLSGMRGVTVDPKARRAQVIGGTLLGAVDRATQPHGLVTPLGTVSHTGVGGLTTGGGFGRVARRFGLALDNVVSVDVVTPDGALVRADATENPDLFWAVRGGGGNFGIVTRFEFALHPMERQIIGGDLAFPFERAAEVLAVYADYALAAPDELYLDFFLVKPPGGGPGSCGMSLCYSGAPAGLDKVLAPLRKLGKPVADTVKPLDYVEIQKSGDISDPRAMGSYLKSGFTSAISPEMARAIVGGFEPDPGRVTIFFTQHCGGAIGRVATGAAAFAHRYAMINCLASTGWPFGTDGEPHIQAGRRYWAGIEKYTKGWYTNEVADETPGQIDANYGPNLARLAALKKRYDPTNLFRLNANVRPG